MEYNLIGVNKGIFNYNPIVINNTTKSIIYNETRTYKVYRKTIGLFE